MQDAAGAIRQFLAGSFKDYPLQDDEDIFGLGFVNSLFAIQLVLFLEQAFGITIESEDLELDNFRTVLALSALVGRKLAGTAEATDGIAA